jgi:hypothetical protein
MRKWILVLLLCCIGGVGWGQGKKNVDSIITINLSKDSFIPSYVKKGTYVRFKITHINTFKVFGSVKMEGSTPSYEVSKDMAKLFPTEVAKSSEKNKPSKIFRDSSSVIRDTITVEQSHNFNPSPTDRFTSSYNTFIDILFKIQEYNSLGNKLKSKIADSIFINDRVAKANCKSDYLACYKHDSIVYDDKEAIIISIKKLSEAYLELSKAFNELNKSTLKQTPVVVSGKLSSKNGATDLNIKDGTISLQRNLVFEKEIALAEKNYNEVWAQKSTLISQAQSAIDLYYQIKNDSFTYISLPQQLIEDETKIIPQLKNGKGDVVYSYEPITLKTYGGWKVNLSAGYFLNFIGNDNFASITNSSGQKEVLAGNKDKVTSAIGALMHVYKFRPDHCLQLGFSFGTSLSDNTNLGFYAGGSLFFTEKNRLVLTAGYAFNKIQRLNTVNLTPNGHNRYMFANNIDTDIKYDNVYQGSVFVSLTYNIFNSSSK